MKTADQIPSGSISRVCSTFVGGVFVTSIIVMGNGSVTVDHNYDCPEQIVSYFNEKAAMYASFTSRSCISFNVPGYSSNKNINLGIEQVTVNEEKLENLKKLEEISMLQDNWNANGAKAFSDGLISKVRNLLIFLEIQPEVFPTACESLQLEYDKQDGSHMEIELAESESAEIFVIDSTGCESISNIRADIDIINKVVRDFYG